MAILAVLIWALDWAVTIAKRLGDNLGNAYQRLGDFKQAIGYHNQHLSIAEDLGDSAGEGTAYGNHAIAYQRLGDFKQAIEYQNQGLSIAKEVGDRAGEGKAYNNLGIVYQSLGDFNKAIEYHKQHLTIAKDLGDRGGEGHAYDNLGKAHHCLGDFKQAIEYHNHHLSIAKELGDRARERFAYGNLGKTYHCLGDFEEAIQYHNKVLSIAKELGDRHEEGCSYCNLGKAYHNLNDFRQAIKYYDQHLSIAKELGDRAREGCASGNLGETYHCLGDFKQAIEYYDQHLSIAKELGDRAGEGCSYCNLGKAYHNLNDFRQAIKYYDQHLSIAKELGDRAEEGRAYDSLGNAYKNRGNFEEAIKYHNQHLSIAKELGDRAEEGRAYGTLGNVYQSLSDFKEAIKYHNRHLSIAKELGDRRGEGHAYCNLGNAYQSLGDHGQAINYQNQALSIAKELGDRAGEGAAYCNIGKYYGSLGDYKQAIKYHNQILSNAKERGETINEGIARFSLGRDYELSGHLEDSRDNYRLSLKLYNDIRDLLISEDNWKVSFCSSYPDAYSALWRVLSKLEKHDEALCVAEQGRAQSLVDLLKFHYDSELSTLGSMEQNVTMAGLPSEIFTQTVFLALECTKIHFWVLNKERKVQFVKKEMVGEHWKPFLERLRTDVLKEHNIDGRGSCENRSLDELRNTISPTETFAEETEETIPCNNNSLRLFHDCVIAPIADLLEGDEVIIVPEGPLCLAPYAAFLDDEFRYLSQSVRVRIVPSLTSLKLISNSARDFHCSSGALLVGDPCLEEITNEKGGPRLMPLPCARQEVKMIGEMLSIAPLIGKEATKDEVLRRIGSVALVHIAAHGDIKAGEIALAPNPVRTSKIPDEKDFIMKISDVQAAKLRARLVVLSCCHSAQGRVTPEGVVGISRAFLGAGARSVLVSLWAIDDAATMEFMKFFYEHLARGCSASVALNSARECLRESENFNAVEYWAPFTLIGDDVTIEFGQSQ